MAGNNTQPLYKGGSPSFPLSESPYYSRTESKNVDFAPEEQLSEYKNYKSIAFRPGFSLQASELNEIQENFQMQMTLSTTMMHNWVTSGSGYLWDGFNINTVNEGDVNDGAGVDSPRSGIGVGGGRDGAGNPEHDQNYVVSGPGWRGATPLYPFKSPYQGENQTAPINSVSVIMDGLNLNFTFNPGWWLVETKPDVRWDGTESNQPSNVSGLKHWVYLELPVTQTVENYSSSKYTVVGLDVRAGYVGCEEDDDLADNASGIPNSASCGASRYYVNIKDAGSASSNTDGEWDTGQINTRERLNAVCVIEPGASTVRYMNNLLLYVIPAL